MSIEWLDQYGNISVDKIDPAALDALDAPRSVALLSLIDASAAKTIAGERVAATRKRMLDAVANEAIALQAHEDASMVIPFTTAKIEAQLGRPLSAGEMQEARRAHGVRCREVLASRERLAASAAYVPQQ